MEKIKVSASREYEVIIHGGILADAGKYIESALGGRPKLAVITDDRVNALHGDSLESALSGFELVKFVFKNGEASKTAETYLRLLNFCAESGLTRSDALFALGGGVVGDLTGFAAATFLRGIRFVQIPTTLLAAVDSSVGGKTGVDLRAGKNLAGAFHQPSLVLCDTATLDTLSPEIFADGCAEVVKYGVIRDRELFDRLCGNFRENKEKLEEIIARCVRHKAEIVEADEFDLGTRQLLNLGHTVGHAIEACSEMRISHGSAVAIGMVIVTRAAASLGLCPEEDLTSLISLLKKLGLPTECSYSADELASVASADKKRAGSKITLVLPFGIGDSRLYPISVDELSSLIEKGLA